MDRIFTEIRDSVAKEAEQLVRRAQRVAEREKQHAQREAEEIISEYREKARREAQSREERIHAHRVIETRKQELAQRQAFVETVFGRVLEGMRTRARDDEYRAWLQRMIKKGLAQFRDEKPVVYCSAQDRTLVESLAGEYGVTCAEESLDITGGIVLKSTNKRVTIDCSAEAELERVKEELRDAVLDRLQMSQQQTK